MGHHQHYFLEFPTAIEKFELFQIFNKIFNRASHLVAPTCTDWGCDRSFLELSRIGVLSGGFRLAVESDDFNLAWQLLVELRKEMLETQKIRTQVINLLELGDGGS